MEYFREVTFKWTGNHIIFLTAVGYHQANIFFPYVFYC